MALAPRDPGSNRTTTRGRKPRPVKRRPVYGPPSPPKAGPPTPARLRKPGAQSIERAHILRAQHRHQQRIKQHVTSLAGDRPADYRRGRQQASRVAKAERVAFLRRTRKQTPIGAIPGVVAHAVDRELSGHGPLAHAILHLAANAGHRSAVQNLGGRSTATVLASTGGSNDFAARLLHDAANLPAQVVPSLYVPAKAAVQAAGGNTKPAKKILRDLNKHDPFVNLAAAGGDILKGNTHAAGKRWKAALKAANEHPGYTLAEGRGISGALDRGLGAGARAAGKEGAPGVRGKVGRVASRERAPRTVPGTNLVEHRRGSKGLVGGVLERHHERGRIEEVRNLRAMADRIENDNPARAGELRREANRKDPTVMSSKGIRRRTDERVSANEDVRRAHRGRTVHAVHKVQKPLNRSERKAVSLVAQNITSATKADLANYLRQLEGEHEGLGRSQRHANEALRRQIRQVLDAKDYNPAKVERVAREYATLTKPLQRGLVERQMLTGHQAERAALIPYAVQKMGAIHDPEKGLVRPDGSELSNEAIRAHMHRNGVPESAFLTQAPNMRGGRNFNVRSEQPQMLHAARRTGASTKAGTFDAHPDTLTENAAHAQGVIDAVDGFHRFVHEFSVRTPEKKLRVYANRRRAEAVVNDLNARHEGTHFQAIRVQPFGANHRMLADLLDHPEAEQVQGFKDLLDEALRGEGDTGPWAIIPKAAADQLRQHIRVMGPGGTAKAWQAFNSLFRQTVLATSPTWLAGNIVEAGLRSTLAKAGPRSYVTGRRTLAELKRTDPAAYDEAVARTVAGGHYSFASRAHVRRDASQFQDSPYEGIANALAQVRRTPGPKHVADAWNAYSNFVFNSLNGRLEAQFQTAMLGKALRDSPLMDRHTLKMSRVAVEQAARGLRDTNEQVALGRAVDRMYGQYGKFSPTRKMMVAYYTPFIAWSLNAVRFVLGTIPRDHPVTLAVIAASERLSEQWRKDHGLDRFMKGAVPGWLQGSIPLSGDRKFQASRFTPFGAFGDPLNTIGGSVLPQISGIEAIWTRNEDWKGKKLRKANGEPADFYDQLIATAGQLVDSTVPAVALAKRVRGKGPAALNPFNPIQPTKPAGGGLPVAPGPAPRSGNQSRASQLMQRRAAKIPGVNGVSQQRLQEILRRRQQLLARHG
jgi:hypothetical protein